MEPTAGGAYAISLVDKATDNKLRTFKVTLGSKESTKPVRSGPVSIIWDPAEAYGDVTVDHDFSIRVFVPK